MVVVYSRYVTVVVAGLLLAIAIGVISGVVIGFILLLVIFAFRRRSDLIYFVDLLIYIDITL